MTEEKPDYYTGYMMVKDILPELSKRINLGADKYAPDDWKGREPKYFWDKFHRHMNDATSDWNAIDEDGLPHLTAMWFHITALVWKRQFEQPVSQAEWYKPHPGFYGDDEVEDFEEWLEGEGLELKNGKIYDPYYETDLSQEDEKQVRKEYNEYLEARTGGSSEQNEVCSNPSKEPTEDNEVLCGTNDSVSRDSLRKLY